MKKKKVVTVGFEFMNKKKSREQFNLQKKEVGDHIKKKTKQKII